MCSGFGCPDLGSLGAIATVDWSSYGLAVDAAYRLRAALEGAYLVTHMASDIDKELNAACSKLAPAS